MQVIGSLELTLSGVREKRSEGRKRRGRRKEVKEGSEEREEKK